MAFVKIVTTVPVEHAEAVRIAAGDAGAGRSGKYRDASFSTLGAGRFFPLPGAHPAIGIVGKPQEVSEERIEWTCSRDAASAICEAIRKVHPYEEPVIDIYPLEMV